MAHKDIEQALEKMFFKHRLVFWYDEKQELREDFDAVELDGVEKVIVSNNEYNLKYSMLKEQPRQNFLIYRPEPHPKPIDNWLYDLERAHTEFRTDQNAIWRNEMDLGIEYQWLFDDHKEFFSKSAKRRESFKNLLDTEQDNDGLLKRKMLAVCVGAKQPRIDSVLEALLEELAKDKNDSERLIGRCGLNDFLWKEAKAYYHYDSETAGIEDFIIEVFKACFAIELGKKADLKDSVIGFLNRWKNNRLHETAFKTLSKKYAKLLKIRKELESIDYRKLIEIDYFADLDQKILSSLVREVKDQTISREDCTNIIRQRRMSYWFKNYTTAYEAIDFASQFINTLDTIKLAPQSFNDGVQKYVNEWYKIDFFYRKYIYSYRSFGEAKPLLRDLYEKIEQLYSNKYLLTLSDNWQKHIDDLNKWSGFDALLQRDLFNKHVKPSLDVDKKIYVIISDAFRYEVGREMVTKILQEDRYNAKIEGAISQLPSYTQLGMASLLPNEKIEFCDDNSGRVIIDALPATGTAGRNKILKQQEKSGTAIQSKELMKMDRDQSRDLLKENSFLYIYHNHIDSVGDKRDTEERVFDAAEKTIEELMDVVKKLTNANATNIIITADHGFLFQNHPIDESDYLSTDASGTEICYHDRRFVLGKGLKTHNSFKSFTAKELGIEGDMEVQIPKSINRLRKQGSGSRFVHGGASLQEIVIPVIKINKKRQSDTSRVGVEILHGTTSTITSGQHSVVFYQKELSSEKVQPRYLKVGLWAGDELISDSHELIFDSIAESPRDRETRVRFILTKKADEFNNKEVYLRLEEKVAGTSHYEEYKSLSFLIRRSFTSDFDL